MPSNYFIGTPGRKSWENGKLAHILYTEPQLFEVAENVKRMIVENQVKAIELMQPMFDRYPQYRITLQPFNEKDIFFEAMPNVNGRQVVILVERNQNESDNSKSSNIEITIVAVPEASENRSIAGRVGQLYIEMLGIIFKSCNPREFFWGPQMEGESDQAYKNWLNRLGTPNKNVSVEMAAQDFLGYQPGRIQTALHIYLEAIALPNQH